MTSRIRTVPPDAGILELIAVLRALGDPAALLQHPEGIAPHLLLGTFAGASLSAAIEPSSAGSESAIEPIAAQLRAFGARIDTTGGKLPARVSRSGAVQTRRFILIEPSADVKNALLLAAVFAREPIEITGDRESADHLERLLARSGADIRWDGRTIALRSNPASLDTTAVPGDFAVAAGAIAAAAVTPGAELRIQDAGVNPTRTALIDVLRSMGADIRLENERQLVNEPLAEIVVRHAPLHGTVVAGDLAMRVRHELPLVALAAVFAAGETKITATRAVAEAAGFHAVDRLLGEVGGTFERLPNGMLIAGGRPQLERASADSIRVAPTFFDALKDLATA